MTMFLVDQNGHVILTVSYHKNAKIKAYKPKPNNIYITLNLPSYPLFTEHGRNENGQQKAEAETQL